VIDDAEAERLAQVATQLATRVRDYATDDNAKWLVKQLPDPTDWFRLSFALAAAIPEDRTWRALTSWTQPEMAAIPMVRRAPECGTASGYRRHTKTGEKACEPCKAAERERGRRRRQAAERSAALHQAA
jgi:hypothetical protein